MHKHHSSLLNKTHSLPTGGGCVDMPRARLAHIYIDMAAGHQQTVRADCWRWWWRLSFRHNSMQSEVWPHTDEQACERCALGAGNSRVCLLLTLCLCDHNRCAPVPWLSLKAAFPFVCSSELFFYRIFFIFFLCVFFFIFPVHACTPFGSLIVPARWMPEQLQHNIVFKWVYTHTHYTLAHTI